MIRRTGPGRQEDLGPGAGVPSRYNRRKYRTKGNLTAYMLAKAAVSSFELTPETPHQIVREAVSRLAVSSEYEGARLFNPDDDAVKKLLYEAEWILWDHLGLPCEDEEHERAA